MAQIQIPKLSPNPNLKTQNPKSYKLLSVSVTVNATRQSGLSVCDCHSCTSAPVPAAAGEPVKTKPVNSTGEKTKH